MNSLINAATAILILADLIVFTYMLPLSFKILTLHYWCGIFIFATVYWKCPLSM